MDTLDFKLHELLKQLPRPLKLEALNYLNGLKQKRQQQVNTKNEKSEFKAGFGGGKGLFVLKEDWDSHLSDEFADYQ